MAKRKKIVKDIRENRISDLPTNLIDCILERMTIRDAARTSILSRQWRYIWASSSQIVFDKQLFEGQMENKAFGCHQDIFHNIINKIMLVHQGLILKFVLHIPEIHFDKDSYMDEWILFLSRHGIKELTLENSKNNSDQTLSHIYLCQELRYMKISKFIMEKPPCEFGGFGNLVYLYVKRISFCGNVFGTLLPNAKSLTFINCTGMEHIKINTPQLSSLAVLNSHAFNWKCLENNKSLKRVHIALHKHVKNVDDRTINLVNFVNHLPRVEKLLFDCYSLKFLDSGTTPKYLPTLIENLKRLKLKLLDFTNLNHISSALFLLRSSPNLVYLEIKNLCVPEESIELGLSYLEEVDCVKNPMDKLKGVKIRHFLGLKTELCFVKLILSNSPLLERLVIKLSTLTMTKPNEKVRISREVMQFSQASTKAKIVFLDANNNCLNNG